jgi:1,4-alpha-glucan branching enzyme
MGEIMHSGNYVLILHTHLPWVLHHGNWPHGEDWLTEAAAECYIPLLNIFNELMEEGVPPKVTLDISPVLCEQLEHPDFKNVFLNYCDEKIEAAQTDEKNFTDWGYDKHHIYLTQFWQQWFEQKKHDYIHKYNGSIIGGFKKLQDEGAIEVMTCGATHGYLPLLGTDESINLQIKAAVENYKKHFGRNPRGIWLPECAYRPSYDWHSMIPVAPYHQKHLRPGIEQFLAKFDIEYFVTDQDLLERSWQIGAYLDAKKQRFVSKNCQDFPSDLSYQHPNPMEIYHVSSSDKVEYGTSAIYTRHRDISMQVWSGEVGYPGEPDYLDFHKKHLGSMLRYWRVTDNKADMMYKTLYHPDWTFDKIDKQSNHFIHHIENSSNWFNSATGLFTTICTPFDTELFGHWWFEGPLFLKAVIKGLSHSPYVNSATASEQFIRTKPQKVIGLPEGSWGVNNNHDVWINEGNKWTWEVIYNNENRMKKMKQLFDANKNSKVLKRILTQTLREMMLLHSSDWQFLIYTESAKDYAEQRFSFHHTDFNRLCDLAERYAETKHLSPQDKLYLDETERRNAIFKELKIDWWQPL